MTAIEIRSEINKVIEHIPEGSLIEALNLLKGLQEQADDNAKLDRHLQIILTEDKELLDRLAK